MIEVESFQFGCDMIKEALENLPNKNETFFSPVISNGICWFIESLWNQTSLSKDLISVELYSFILLAEKLDLFFIMTT